MKTLLFAVFSLFAVTAFAQTPTVVRDSRSKAVSTSPRRMTVWNGSLYYTASTAAHGTELWVYDGIDTPRMVADENPGTASSFDAEIRDRMIVCRNRLFFGATSPSRKGEELYSYSGGPALNMEADLNTVDPKGSRPEGFLAIGNKLYFRASVPGGQYSLFVSDGSTAPRIVVTPDDGRGDDLPMDYKGKIYFGKDSGAGTGRELCILDPATDTWKLAADIDPGPADGDPSNLTTALGRLYYIAKTASHGLEIHCYDGAYEKRVTDMQPGPTDGIIFIYLLAAGFKGDLYFINKPMSTSTAIHLYRLDTASGNVSPVTPVTMTYSVNNNVPVEFDGALYFYGGTPANGTELWKYDGTTCSMVADLYPGKETGIEAIRPVVYKNALYFSGRKNGTDYELYRISGKSTAVEAVQWNGSLSVSPNPVQDLARFEITLPASQSLRITLVDVAGRTIRAKDLMLLPAGRHSVTMTTDQLPPAQYFYQLSGEHGELLRSGAIVKQ